MLGEKIKMKPCCEFDLCYKKRQETFGYYKMHVKIAFALHKKLRGKEAHLIVLSGRIVGICSVPQMNAQYLTTKFDRYLHNKPLMDKKQCQTYRGF